MLRLRSLTFKQSLTFFIASLSSSLNSLFIDQITTARHKQGCTVEQFFQQLIIACLSESSGSRTFYVDTAIKPQLLSFKSMLLFDYLSSLRVKGYYVFFLSLEWSVSFPLCLFSCQAETSLGDIMPSVHDVRMMSQLKVECACVECVLANKGMICHFNFIALSRKQLNRVKILLFLKNIDEFIT